MSTPPGLRPAPGAKKGKTSIQLRRVERDRYGEETPGDPIATLKGCIPIPRTLGEDNDRGSVAIKGHNIYVPPGRHEWVEDVAPDDRVIRDSDQLEVLGEWTDIEGHPAHYINDSGLHAGTMVTTRGEVLT